MTLTEDEVRKDWANALRQVRHGADLSPIIEWAFSDKDISELAKLHKANKFRKKILDLLEDCNFHREYGDFEEGEYSKYITGETK